MGKKGAHMYRLNRKEDTESCPCVTIPSHLLVSLPPLVFPQGSEPVPTTKRSRIQMSVDKQTVQLKFWQAFLNGAHISIGKAHLLASLP